MTCFTRNIQQRTLWFGRKLNNSQKCRWYIQNMYKKNFIHYIRKGWSLAESLCLHRGFLMFLLVIFSLSSKGNILWWDSWKSPVGTLKLLAGNIENPSRVSWNIADGYSENPSQISSCRCQLENPTWSSWNSQTPGFEREKLSSMQDMNEFELYHRWHHLPITWWWTWKIKVWSETSIGKKTWN